MRAAIVLILIVACAKPAARPTSPLTGAEIVKRMTASYASATAYHDRGRLALTASTASGDQRVELTFEIAFRRTEGFRLAYGDARGNHVIWLDGARVLSADANGVIEDRALTTALAEQSEASAGLTTLVPGLLMPHVAAPIPISLLSEYTADGHEPVDGHACSRVRGRATGAEVTLWIDDNSYLLRKMITRVGGSDGSYEETFTADAAFAEPSAPQLKGPDVGGIAIRKRKAPSWLGVRFARNTLQVEQVMDPSPAHKAGLQVGDEVVSIDGAAASDTAETIQRIASTEPGATITLVLKRSGANLTLPVTLEPRPDVDKLVHDSLVDKPAPAFSATSLDGATVNLADLRGQVVLVEFWATWCGPCAMQFPHLVRWHKQFATKGLRILALSSEEREVLRDFSTEHKLTYPIAIDADDAIRGRYLAAGIPTTVIIDKTGVVRFVAVGVTEPARVESVLARLLH